jgi:galactitol-specific phosphotransferase system IIB component
VSVVGGGVVYLPPGTYRVATTLNGANNVVLAGAGRGLSTLLCDDVTGAALDYRGAIGFFTNYAFAAATSLSKGARSVALASVSGLAVGDWVMIDDSETVAGNNRESWVTRIVDISGSTVYLAERAPRSFLTANSPVLHAISGGPRVGAAVKDITFKVNVGLDVPATNRSTAILLGSALAPVVQRCEFQHFTYSPVYIEWCRDALIKDCTFFRNIDPAGAATSSAAVVIVSCTKTQVRDCQTTRGGFGMTAYRSPWTSFVGNDLSGSTDVYSAAIPTDDGGRGIKLTTCAFSRVVANGVSDFAYNGIVAHDSESVLIADNVITNCRDQGIQVMPYDGSSSNASSVDIVISGNVIDNIFGTIPANGSLGTGIICAYGRATIVGNSITNVTGSGILVQASDCIVQGNLLDTIGTASGNSGGTIELASSAARCLILGNTTRSSSTAAGIYTQNGNGTSSIALNHLDKAPLLHASDTITFFSSRIP